MIIRTIGIIFGERHKENALSLYNAINNSNYTNADDLEMYTIEDAIYVKVKNDVAFLFDDSMNLIEQQSTCNPNMPLRGLDYFAALYRKYINDHCGGHTIVFGSRLVHVPTPHYCVFYNGRKEEPDRQDLHLSDAYEGSGDLDITAHVININYGKSKELFEACAPLAGYSVLVQRVRDNICGGMDRNEAIEKAIQDCKKDTILVDILTWEVSKVTDSLLAALTDQEIEELHEYEVEMGRKEGVIQGREDGIALGREEGIALGHEEGAAQSESAISELFKRLEKDSRSDDFARAMNDKEYLHELMKEYGIR